MTERISISIEIAAAARRVATKIAEEHPKEANQLLDEANHIVQGSIIAGNTTFDEERSYEIIKPLEAKKFEF